LDAVLRLTTNIVRFDLNRVQLGVHFDAMLEDVTNAIILIKLRPSG
jgi:hypothetical protein